MTDTVSRREAMTDTIKTMNVGAATAASFAWRWQETPRAARYFLVHGGTPNSRHLYGRWVADANRRGIRRPSYEPSGLWRADGHLTLLVNRFSEVHDWLLRHF